MTYTLACDPESGVLFACAPDGDIAAALDTFEALTGETLNRAALDIIEGCTLTNDASEGDVVFRGAEPGVGFLTDAAGTAYHYAVIR